MPKNPPRTATKKTRQSSRKKTTKKAISKTKQTPLTRRQKWTLKRRAWLARRPHRSFRRTYRRDYERSLQLPSYTAFTYSVWQSLWQHRKVFGMSIVVFSVLSAGLIGIASQDVYVQSADVIKETGSSIFSGAWGEIGKGALLLVSVAGGNFDSDRGEVQQVYGLLVFLLVWLCTVWLIRAHLAGNTPRFRDALYNSSAPLVSTLLIALLFAVQLLPAALGLVLLQVATATLSGAPAMLVGIVTVLLCVLTLYLVTSTFIALVVVTLPGMYPWQALSVAGDLVIGRRVRILLRLLWGVLTTIVGWGIVMVPLVLITAWIQPGVPVVKSLPVVPIALVIVSTAATIFLSAYVYLLYRKVVSDDASPA